MKLTDAAVRNAKPREKDYKISDGRGLYLLVRANGSKLWRYKYRTADGREKLLSFGAYPEITLSAARDALLDARRLVATGKDPSSERKAEKERLRAIFSITAEDWFSKQESWVESHRETVRARLDTHVLPFIGKLPLQEIDTPKIAAVLDRILRAGHGEAARRVRQIISQVFRYAVSVGRATHDPSEPLRYGFFPRRKVENMATLKRPEQFAGVLRAIEGYSGSIVVRCALRLAPLLFLRPGELRKAEWREVDFMRRMLEIPGERTKMRVPLLVPLSARAIAILQELYAVTGHGRYIFPSERGGDRPMSENTINAALRRMGFTAEEQTGHGFRATARTILDEELKFDRDAIEMQLGHVRKDSLGNAYNRTEHLAARVEMMERWSEYCETLAQTTAVPQELVR
jgi:integrase